MSGIKKKDTVEIIAGKDKGKRGEVRRTIPEKNQVLVTGLNMVSKHARATQSKAGGIQKQEAPLDISNVALVCPKCDKLVRPKSSTLDSGEKVRICRKCGEVII